MPSFLFGLVQLAALLLPVAYAKCEEEKALGCCGAPDFSLLLSSTITQLMALLTCCHLIIRNLYKHTVYW